MGLNLSLRKESEKMGNNEDIGPHSQTKAQPKNPTTKRSPKYHMGMGTHQVYMYGYAHVQNKVPAHAGILPVQWSTWSVRGS